VGSDLHVGDLKSTYVKRSASNIQPVRLEISFFFLRGGWKLVAGLEKPTELQASSQHSQAQIRQLKMAIGGT